MNLGLERALIVSVISLTVAIAIVWAPPTLWLILKVLALTMLIANAAFILGALIAIVRAHFEH